ncbi:696_t:CDS:2, partial [Cetraspora pellucida]
MAFKLILDVSLFVDIETLENQLLLNNMLNLYVVLKLLILKAMLDNQTLRHPDPHLNILYSPILQYDPDYYLACLLELVIVYRRDIACSPDFGIHVDEEANTFISILFINSFVSIDPSEISTKYAASDHRTLALLSYFYSTPAMLTNQENTKWCQFEKPLIHHSPWCLDWTKGLTKGGFIFLWRCSLESTFFEIVDESESSQEKGQPPRYFLCPDYPPPDPSEYTFLGLAIIRSIDPVAYIFHILTPLSY